MHVHLEDKRAVIQLPQNRYDEVSGFRVTLELQCVTNIFGDKFLLHEVFSSNLLRKKKLKQNNIKREIIYYF